MDDNDLQRRLRRLADEATPRPGAENRVIAGSRRRRRVTAAVAALSAVALISGLAGAGTLLGERADIDSAPAPEQTSACASANYDLAIFVPEKDFHAKMAELGNKLRAHDAVASVRFVSAAEAFGEYRRENPEWEGNPQTLPRRATASQYRAAVQPGVDPQRLSREFADLSRGTYIPARDCPPPDTQERFACAGAPRPKMVKDRPLVFRPPAAREEGMSEVLPVRFPDGSTGELVYPAQLQIDELYAQPDLVGGPPNGMIRPQILHGGVGLRLEGPTACLEGANGQGVPVWETAKVGRSLIVPKFGDWHVVVFDSMPRLAVWAKNLRGEVDAEGWLELHGDGDLRIGPEFDPGDSGLRFFADTNMLSLQPLDCSNLTRDDDREVVELGGRGSGDWFTSFCIDNVEIHAQGNATFVQAAAEGVRVRNLQTRLPLDHYTTLP